MVFGVGEHVKRSTFPSSLSRVMVGHESSPTHRSFARGLCDRWARCCAAGNTSCGKTAACWRDERYGRYARGHAVLSGRTEEHRGPDCPLVATCMLTIAQVEPSPANVIQVSFETRRLS